MIHSTFLLERRLQKLLELDNVEELETVFVDYLEYHHHVYSVAEFLLNGVSETNILFTRSGTRVLGALNDWDIASSSTGPEQPPLQQITYHIGSPPFLALDHLAKPSAQYLYCHNLESFFCTLVWVTIHYDFNHNCKRQTPGDLGRWKSRSLTEVYTSKWAFLTWIEDRDEVLAHVRKEFHSLRNQWLIPLSSLFFDAETFAYKKKNHLPRGNYRTAACIEQITFHRHMATVGRQPQSPVYMKLPMLSVSPSETLDGTPRMMHYMLRLECRYQKPWELDNVKEFEGIFLDYLQCHQNLQSIAKFLPIDLNEVNLMFTRRKKRIAGVLNDWDLSSGPANQASMLNAMPHSGKLHFMALDHLTRLPAPHLYRHDLESFFYFLVWATVHYDFKRKRRRRTPAELKPWCNADLAYNVKFTFITSEVGLGEVLPCIRPEFHGLRDQWLRPLWKLFCIGTMSYNAHRALSPQSDYDRATYDNRLTFETFMAAIQRQRGRLLGIPAVA